MTTQAHTATPVNTQQDSAPMDSLDRQLLDIIQTGFPLCPRPYAELGQRLGIEEQEALDRVRNLKARKIIRRLGANFQSAKLGFVSTLCAAKVPQDKMESFVAEVNAKPGVTHNYLREHDYNIWFTLISPSAEETQATLDGISAQSGIPILNLPATKLFKIRVDFRMDGGDENRFTLNCFVRAPFAKGSHNTPPPPESTVLVPIYHKKFSDLKRKASACGCTA